MATLDDEIDGLYRLPPNEFTAARNALIKRAGGKAADLRTLQKPNTAAWAVNQVYWRRRDVFDRLAKTSEGLRVAHAKALKGETRHVGDAGTRHRAALDRALDTAIRLLADAGESVPYATIAAISQTLEAVPSPAIRGRLSRPVAPLGFAALGALLSEAARGRVARGPAEVVPIARTRAKPAQVVHVDVARGAREREAAGARRRERTAAAKDLRAAEAREKAARAALARARTAVTRADARIGDLEAALAEARTEAGNAREAADLAQRHIAAASTDRVRLERRLRDLDARDA